MSDILWDDPHFTTGRHHPGLAYAQSKTANVLFTVELDRRWSGDGIRGYAPHPGIVAGHVLSTVGGRTGAARPWASSTRPASRSSTPIAARRRRSRAPRPSCSRRPARCSPTSAASTCNNSDVSPLDDDLTPVDLTDPDAEVPADVAPHSIDPRSARRLWDLSERLIERPSVLGGRVSG